jgi:hypothetical protein
LQHPGRGRKTAAAVTLSHLATGAGGPDGHKPAVLAFCSMTDRRKRLFKEIAERLPAQRDDVAACRDPGAVNARADVRPVVPADRVRPRGAAARGYAALWDEVCARLF